ncbi:MAG TPA: glycosyltransferase family 4 protein [Gemmatimonadaceae bacterium]|nr:glycosyltransferase family 4 protein [Gemmatimonadaceae bacterium]
MALHILVFNWLDRRNPRSGGAEVHLHEVFGRLARAGHRVTLVTSGWRGAPTRELVDGIEVHRVGGRESYYVKVRGYYRRQLADRHFDVVVEDLNKAPLYTPSWVGRPVVLLAHHFFGRAAFLSATLPVATATWLLERTVGLAYRRVDAIAVSESTADELTSLGMRAERISVVHNGVDERLLATQPLGIRDAEPTVLYLGRLERYKRVDLLIRAMARIRDAGDEARLIVAGEGRHAPALRRLAGRLDLGDRVHFAGRVSEQSKRSLMERAWLHAIASTKEGWGISVIEAAACGTPTVASDTPGLRDAVVHDETGVLVRHGDVNALADAIRILLADPSRLRRLSLGARARAEGFTWDAAASAVENVLTAVASRDRPALAGAWARYRQAPPLANIGLPRTGTGVAPYGSASWVVEAVGSDGAATVRVSVGASDWSGRRVLATVRVLQRNVPSAAPALVPRGTDERQTTPPVVELPGWPLDHEVFLHEILVRIVGSPLTLTSVRRVAEPLAPTSPVPERDDRVDRRRTPRRTEAGDHADGRKR